MPGEGIESTIMKQAILGFVEFYEVIINYDAYNLVTVLSLIVSSFLKSIQSRVKEK